MRHSLKSSHGIPRLIDNARRSTECNGLVGLDWLLSRNIEEFEGQDICISNPEGNFAIPSNSHGVPTIITTTAYVIKV
jgi:hypothetical protein